MLGTMPKKAFSITTKNLRFAQKYLYRKITLEDYYPTADTNFDANKSFKKAFSKIELLNQWVEDYLSNEQRKQLIGAIRQQRRRKGHPEVKTISISFEAWRYIEEISKRDEVTLSQVIEKYLRKEYLKAAGIE